MNMLRWWLLLVLGIGLPLLAGCRDASPGVATPAAPPDETWQGKLLLSSPSLTAGIPGKGSLTTAQLRAWLANPANHEVLTVALPLGLRSSAEFDSQQLALTRAKIELGRQLFFDTRLSEQGIFACGTCHQPVRQFTSDILSHARLRETGTAFNRVLTREQFWDGRAKSLEDQIRFPLENPDEFATTPAQCVERIKSIEGYRLQFTAIFGRFDYEALCEAIAAFERCLVTGPSPWDWHVELQRLEQLKPEEMDAELTSWFERVRNETKKQPLRDEALRGAALFFGRANCAGCHSGPNFTDEAYHDVGLRPSALPNSPVRAKQEADLGRFEVTREEVDRHRFKTPTLRNVALTWPYFHDGRYSRLKQVIEHFVRGGQAKNDLEPLDLTKEEMADMVAFLQALTGRLPQPPTDRLP